MCFAVRTSLDDDTVDLKIFARRDDAYSRFIKTAVYILDGRMLRSRTTKERKSAVAVELWEAEPNEARRAKAEVDAGRARLIDFFDEESVRAGYFLAPLLLGRPALSIVFPELCLAPSGTVSTMVASRYLLSRTVRRDD